MLKLISLSALGIAAVAIPALADMEPRGMPVLVDVKSVYVPNGFDDNDEVQLMVEGTLPNTCYRISKTESTYDDATKTVTIKQWARKFRASCLEIAVPFSLEVDLGQLPYGEFTVAARGAAPEKLVVAEASSAGPDEYLYAPIESITISGGDGATRRGTLEGRFVSSCMRLKEVRVIDSGKTVEVLPIAEMAEGEDCVSGETPFTQDFDLPAELTPGRHLLHVRSLNGKALNQMFVIESVP